ncbi:Hypothetical protein H16_B1341 [Cupriavidus necator H16]|uniref:Uncharacterized protein n=1 Tax=Cupriavidus necator (strain ATCC 17699 / DSM 428 / KCTC 22496 / NCIMB 10442 / H16 / Stanier 337) TaxID=381666 RepID=Q0K1J3_CUPNH|nr:Hypothetical protein H16_B1341 [Cupriavidus necator H16]
MSPASSHSHRDGAAILPFLIANGVATLMLARIIRGVSTGVASSVLGAGLLDLDTVRCVMINGLAPGLCLAMGALVSGVLVQYLPFPLRSAHFCCCSRCAAARYPGTALAADHCTPRRRSRFSASDYPCPFAGEVRADPLVADQSRGLLDEWFLSFPRVRPSPAMSRLGRHR